jgi:glycosyltransferase involved in cell wall biosynthesis
MGAIKKIVVCSVQVPFVRGGAEYFTDNLVMRLQERSHQVDRIQLPLQTLPLEEVIKSCLAWRLLNVDRIYNDPIDMVIGTKFPSYMIPHPGKVIWLVHQYREIYDLYGTAYGGFQPTSDHNQFRQHLIDLDQLAFSEAKRIFTISKTVSKRLKDYNGFDSTPLYPPLNDAEEFHYAAQEDFVLSVSRLEGNKRVHLLIEAMQHVSAQFRALIVGEGFLRNEYEETARKCGVSDRIQFLGAVSRKELIDLYSRAGALFYGPIGEDYGYATLEAFYSKKPVITCHDSGGILEFVDPGVTGWVTDTDPRSIAASIEDALSSKEESRRRGEAGREKIRPISWNHVLETLL